MTTRKTDTCSRTPRMPTGAAALAAVVSRRQWQPPLSPRRVRARSSDASRPVLIGKQ
jgi:hypothetical protein